MGIFSRSTPEEKARKKAHKKALEDFAECSSAWEKGTHDLDCISLSACLNLMAADKLHVVYRLESRGHGSIGLISVKEHPCWPALANKTLNLVDKALALEEGLLEEHRPLLAGIRQRAEQIDKLSREKVRDEYGEKRLKWPVPKVDLSFRGVQVVEERSYGSSVYTAAEFGLMHAVRVTTMADFRTYVESLDGHECLLRLLGGPSTRRAERKTPPASTEQAQKASVSTAEKKAPVDDVKCRMRCPNPACGSTLLARAHSIGKKARCPKCGTTWTISLQKSLNVPQEPAPREE